MHFGLRLRFWLNTDLDEDEASRIRFAIIEKIKQFGVVAKIWEEV